MNILDTRPNVTIEIRKLQSRNTISRVRLNYSLNDTMDRYFVIWWRGIICRGLPDRLYVLLDHWIFWLRGKLLPTVLKINWYPFSRLPANDRGRCCCLLSVSTFRFPLVRRFSLGATAYRLSPAARKLLIKLSSIYVSFFNKTLS